MAFLAGMMGGVAKGVGDRHLEERTRQNAQDLQSQRYELEAQNRSKEMKSAEDISNRKALVDIYVEQIKKNPDTTWAQKLDLLDQLGKTAGFDKTSMQSMRKSLEPLGGLHDAAQKAQKDEMGRPQAPVQASPQGFNSIPTPPASLGPEPASNKSVDPDSGDPSGPDPEEFGKHLGYSMAHHSLGGGKPEEMDLTPHLGTLIGAFSGKKKPQAPLQPSPSPGGAQDLTQGPGSGPVATDQSTPSLAPKAEATPLSPIPQQPGFGGALDLQYQNALEGIRTGRDEAKIKVQNQEKLKRVQETWKMIQDQNGEGEGRPVHMKMSPGGEPVIDEGRTHVPLATGSDIREGMEYKGGPKIDPEGFYKGTRYGNAVEWQKIPGVKNRIVIPDQNSPTGFSSAAVMAGGAVSQDPELRSPVAPPASQIIKQTTGGTWKTDPADGQTKWYPTQSTSGPKTPVGAAPPTSSFPPLPAPPGRSQDFTSPGAPPPPPRPPAAPGSGKVTPEVAALADLMQNDLTTGKAMLANYPRNSPVKIAVQNEVNRRMAIGQGPTPVFLGTTARNQVQQAKLMGPEIDMTVKDINNLSEKLGPVMGRWNEFMAGRVGSGDPEFQKLRSDLSLIKSKVSQIHFGSQSGVQAVERFDKIMNADKMDAPTLLAGLSSLSQILKLYGSLNVTSGAAMAEGGANSRATPSSTIPGSPLPGPSKSGEVPSPQILDQYVKVLGRDPDKLRKALKDAGFSLERK